MKKLLFLSIIVLVLMFIGIIAFKNIKSFTKNDTNNASIPIRIGWQIPWATQGQLTQILKHTDILKDNGLEVEFKGFTFGGPLNEAALAGEVDVIFTADQPAATLLSKNQDWTIIGRLMYNRVSLYVPPKSPITAVSDLKGKTVAMPFGAAAQRMVLKKEKEAGLVPGKDVNNINLDIYEQSDLVKNPEAVRWGEIDALGGFDPTPAILEEKGLIRNLAVDKVVSVIVMSNSFIEKRPNAPSRFLQSFYQAYKYYRDHEDQANAWFTKESKLDITPNALDLAASFEPNLKSENEIRIGFTEEDRQIMQEAADFIFEQGLVKTRINMLQYIDESYLNKVISK